MSGHGWIDVRERLPEQDTRVIVAWKNDGRWFTDAASWFPNLKLGGRPIWNDSQALLLRVDYWMPLPAPPTDIEA